MKTSPHTVVRRVTGASLGLLTAASVAAAGDCEIVRLASNDFDTIRAEAGPPPGLPGDGVGYQAATVWADHFAFLNQHGYPLAMFVPEAVADWSLPANYDQVTSVIHALGNQTGTTPAGMTDPREILEWVTQFYPDQFTLTSTIVDLTGSGYDSVLWMSPNRIASQQITGLAQWITGVFLNDDGEFLLQGTHHYNLRGISEFCAPKSLNVMLHDPVSFDGPHAQSPYTTIERAMLLRAGLFQAGSYPEIATTLWELQGMGWGHHFLMGVRWLHPMSMVAYAPSSASIEVIRPVRFDDTLPEREVVSMPDGLTAAGVAHHPTGAGLVVLARAATMHQVLWLPEGSTEFQTIVPMTGADPTITTDRFGDVYVGNQSLQRWILVHDDDGGIISDIVAEVALSEHAVQVAWDDFRDYIMVFGASGLITAYSRDLNPIWEYPLPKKTIGAGEYRAQLGADPTRLYVANESDRILHEFQRSPGGVPLLRASHELPVDNMRSFVVMPSGRRVLVVDDGDRSVEVTRQDDDTWVLSDVTGLAGYAGIGCIEVPRSRTNEARFSDPAFDPLLPELIFPASDICFADVDRDGAVGVADILAVLAQWGASCEIVCSADVTQSGDVGIADLLAVLSAWGECW